jgi:hypothetical protein
MFNFLLWLLFNIISFSPFHNWKAVDTSNSFLDWRVGLFFFGKQVVFLFKVTCFKYVLPSINMNCVVINKNINKRNVCVWSWIGNSLERPPLSCWRRPQDEEKLCKLKRRPQDCWRSDPPPEDN